MPTSINIKLADRSEYEMMIGRVLKRELPHGAKKHFFLNLCRLVITPEMDDEEALRRIQRVVDDGASSVLLPPVPQAQVRDVQSEQLESEQLEDVQTHQGEDGEAVSHHQESSTSPSLGNKLGSMFGN